jgi:hypothetical protein
MGRKMNERIKQLAEQARQYAEDKQNDPLKIYTLDCFNEKFALLIVRECIDTAFHRGHPDLEFLLKHFGVEE